MKRIFFPCFVLLICLSATLAIAQTGGGAVVGTVHDPSGAVIPKANVTLTNTDTGTSLTTASTSAGAYNFPAVPVGHYTVTVAASGFEQTVSQNVVVALNKTANVDVQLQIGAATSTVQVQARSSQLETTTSQNATTIDQQTYDNLPFAMVGGARSVTAVAIIMPGVSQNDGASYQTPGTTTAQTYAASISGGQAWAGAQLYDGLPMISVNQGGNYKIQPVPVEALQEFSLVQNNFSPELGQTPGGLLSYSTRSGTNAYHGQAYEYLRNNDLDAAGYFASHAGAAPTHQNEFGVNVGGPVIIPHVYDGKGKLFFFGFYSGFRLAGAVTPSAGTIPTLAEQGGDFSALPQPIYDPTTTTCDALGNCTRQQYQYNGKLNVIDPTKISSVATTYNKYLLTPVNGNLTNNIIVGGVNNANEDRFGGRIDYHLRQNDQIYGFFSTGPVSSGAYNIAFLSPLSTYGASIASNYYALLRLGWDHTFTPNVLLHLGTGYNKQGSTSTPPYNNDYISFGITNGLSVTPQQYFNPNNSPYATNGGNGGTIAHEHAYAYDGFLAWTRGRSQFKFGGMFYTGAGNHHNNSTIVDRWVTVETGQIGVADSGDAYASMQSGALDSAVESDSPASTTDLFLYADGYFNDDYKLLPDLTINAGIRYEVPWTLHVKNDIQSSFEPNYPNPGAGGLPGALVFQGHGAYSCQCERFASTRYVLWQPRVGFAYKADNKTVVHGGYGLFMSISGSSLENGYSTQLAVGYNAAPSWQSTNGGTTPAFYAQNGYPSFVPPPFINPSYVNNGAINWTPRSSGLPGVISNYSLSVQRELPANFVLDIAYVGNTAQHLGSNLINPNQIPIGDIAEYGAGVLGSKLSSPAGQASGVPLPFVGFTGTVAQALRSYPQYQSVTAVKQNGGHSVYNALQAKLQRQFHNGFSTLVSYTWASQLSTGEDEVGQFDDGPQDAFSLQGEYAPANTQAPQVLSITYVYDLPFGYNRKYLNHGIAATVLGGWGVAGIQRYQTGNAMYSLTSQNNLPIGNSRVRPNYVPGESEKATWVGKFNPRVDPYLNAAAFAQPAPNTFGNAARDIPLRSFGYYDEALSARKDFHIYEADSLQFRADFFNAFNRSNFADLNGGTSNPGISPSFGLFGAQTNSPRSIELALKLLF